MSSLEKISVRKEQITAEKQRKAEIHLTNIQICDMCLVKNYICEYRKYYYQLSDDLKPVYLRLFINKLPYPVNKIIMDKFNENCANGSCEDTLGGAIDTVRQEILSRCLVRNTNKQSGKAVKICCNNAEVPQRYGCQPAVQKLQAKRKPFKKVRKTKKNWQRKRLFKRKP